MANKTAPLSKKPTKARSARLEARISQRLNVIIKRAAELQGRTVTDFVAEALNAAATDVITRHDELRLTVSDQAAFAKSLITPPKPNAALKRAFAKANTLIAS